MAWIESHQALVHHPKLFKLVSLTGWRATEAIGTLHRLWWWTLSYAESGYLGDHQPEVISHAIDALETEKYKHENLFEVLSEAKFMTKNNFVNDWLDYAGRYLKTKYHTANPDKLQQIKDNFDKPIGKKGAKLGKPKVRTKLSPYLYLPTYLNQPTLTNLICSLEEILVKCKRDLSQHIVSDNFLQSYLEWTLYKKDIKSPVTKNSIHKQFDSLAEYDVGTSIRMIDHAIEKDWKGLYPVNKVNGKGRLSNNAQAVKEFIDET